MSGDDDLTYGSHLRLDSLLDLQHPVSTSHDETLFIIQHQTSELWMKLILAELDMARNALNTGQVRQALKPLERIRAVLDHLVGSWNVLRTLSPTEFSAFRGALGGASGLQSWQYRLIEFRLGNRRTEMLAAHPDGSKEHAKLLDELEKPSLYHAAVTRVSEAIGTPVPAASLPLTEPHRPDDSVEAVWRAIYGAPEAYPDLLNVAEALIRIEDAFRCWRFNHVTTVERVIGTRPGTGGTSGVGYLRKVLEVELFPELWRLRNTL